MINPQTEKIIKEVVNQLKSERDEKENHFKEWGIKKVQIDELDGKLLPRERDIYWVSVGYNIGSEIFGKGKAYTRPVLVINAEAGNSFVGVPLTSKVKSKKHTVAIKLPNGNINDALIYQIRNYDKKRLVSKMCVLDVSEFQEIKKGLKALFKI